MKHSEEQILKYAERRVRMSHSKDTRFGLITMGIFMVGVFPGTVWMMKDSPTWGEFTVLTNEYYLAGLVAGMLSTMWFVISAFGLVKVFRLSRGIEGQALELLVKLARERSGGTKDVDEPEECSGAPVHRVDSLPDGR